MAQRTYRCFIHANKPSNLTHKINTGFLLRVFGLSEEGLNVEYEKEKKIK